MTPKVFLGHRYCITRGGFSAFPQFNQVGRSYLFGWLWWWGWANPVRIPGKPGPRSFSIVPRNPFPPS